MRACEVRELGRLGYQDALTLQNKLVLERQQGLISDQLLFVEHSELLAVSADVELHISKCLRDGFLQFGNFRPRQNSHLRVWELIRVE